MSRWSLDSGPFVTSLTAEAASCFSGNLRCRTGQSSPEDVPRGVDVCMTGVPPGPTDEGHAVAVPRVDVPARVTSLRGVLGIYRDHDPPSVFRFGGEDRGELSPARIQDRTVEAALGGHVGARQFQRPGGRTGHVFDRQVFERDDVVGVDETTCDLVVVVPALVGDLAMPIGDDGPRRPSVERAALLA